MASAEALPVPTSRLLSVQVAFSPAARQVALETLQVSPGTTVQQALRDSGWWARHPSVDQTNATLGIWGRRVAAEQPLRDGDRIEVYRSLLVDPKEARRLRYRAQGERGRRGPTRSARRHNESDSYL